MRLAYLLVLVYSVCAVERKLEIHDNSMMMDTDVTSKTVVTKPCKCIIDCYVNPACQAVASEEVSTNVTCYFSLHFGVQTRLTSRNTATTYVKKECADNFVRLGGICYFFSSETADQATAKTKCPATSSLAFPSSGGELNSLVDYIKKNKAHVENWYVDLTKTNDKWYWGDRVNYRDAIEINGDNESCARLRGSSYELADCPCSTDYNFICQYTVQT
ncbi:uncharacterized protein LOC108678910 [Hyalella azteca]|uniref:Uncharacterized protein LOC108678910 n=1 Tax=Hyalella azteca TaxID=294128 RepID=A0A8B7PCE4_HYAAZ|nr:uncharacterized protein LOC108678910 [Hyalella azteca]